VTKDDLIETLASIEHTRWANWQKYLHSTCREQPGTSGRRSLVIKENDVEHWERQIVTPYAHLSEAEKEADRNEARQSLPVIIDFVAAWLEESDLYANAEGPLGDKAARLWREAMS
jgi:hypothetical protein